MLQAHNYNNNKSAQVVRYTLDPGVGINIYVICTSKYIYIYEGFLYQSQGLLTATRVKCRNVCQHQEIVIIMRQGQNQLKY